METDGGKRWRALEELRRSIARVELALAKLDYGIACRVPLGGGGDLVFTSYQGEWCLLFQPDVRLSNVKHDPFVRRDTAVPTYNLTGAYKLGLPSPDSETTLRCARALPDLIEQLGVGRKTCTDDLDGTRMLVEGLADSLEADQD